MGKNIFKLALTFNGKILGKIDEIITDKNYNIRYLKTNKNMIIEYNNSLIIGKNAVIVPNYINTIPQKMLHFKKNLSIFNDNGDYLGRLQNISFDDKIEYLETEQCSYSSDTILCVNDVIIIKNQFDLLKKRAKNIKVYALK